MEKQGSKGRKIIKGALLCVAALCIFYFGIAAYFADRFLPGTWVNGVYATGKTVDEIGAQVGEEYTDALRSLHSLENPLLWGMGLTNGKSVAFYTDFRAAAGEALVGNTLLTRAKPLTAANARTGVTGAERSAVTAEAKPLAEPGTYETYATVAKRETNAAAFLLAKRTRTGVRRRFQEITEQNAPELRHALDRFLSLTYTFDMGEGRSETLGEEELPFFLRTDTEGKPYLTADGTLAIDEDKVGAYVDSLCHNYDTVNMDRSFVNAAGETVLVPAGTYGDKIDAEKEKAYLLLALKSMAPEAGHVPAYSAEAKARGVNDVGDTYVEIDIERQHLYYFENGVSVFDTDIVTGNTKLRRDTPAGAFYVYGKQKNRTLRGPDYESFVKYWMPVYRGVGIHDASWRGKFGGSIYTYDGSHGCINLPTKKAAELYDMVQVGTPVLIYHSGAESE